MDAVSICVLSLPCAVCRIKATRDRVAPAYAHTRVDISCKSRSLPLLMVQNMTAIYAQDSPDTLYSLRLVR